MSKFKDKTRSIQTVEEIWSSKENKRLAQEAELVTHPNAAWKLGEDAATWEPPRDHTFEGSQGGGVPGPTAKIKDHINVRREPDAIKHPADLFMFFFPLTLLTFVANESNCCAFKD